MGADRVDGMRVLIGGVGYRWQRDGSVGLVLADRLAAREWPPRVEVMDLGYGALYAAQDVAAAQPPYQRVVLLAAAHRGRAAGRLYRRSWHLETLDEAAVQARIRESAAGVIDLDHLLVIGQWLGAWPEDTIVLEVEPVDVSGGEPLSEPVAALLPEIEQLTRVVALAPPAARAENRPSGEASLA